MALFSLSLSQASYTEDQLAGKYSSGMPKKGDGPPLLLLLSAIQVKSNVVRSERAFCESCSYCLMRGLSPATYSRRLPFMVRHFQSERPSYILARISIAAFCTLSAVAAGHSQCCLDFCQCNKSCCCLSDKLKLSALSSSKLRAQCTSSLIKTLPIG